MSTETVDQKNPLGLNEGQLGWCKKLDLDPSFQIPRKPEDIDRLLAVYGTKDFLDKKPWHRRTGRTTKLLFQTLCEVIDKPVITHVFFVSSGHGSSMFHRDLFELWVNEIDPNRLDKLTNHIATKRMYHSMKKGSRNFAWFLDHTFFEPESTGSRE